MNRSTLQLPLVLRYSEGKHFLTRSKSEIDAAAKAVREIERQKVLRVLAASTTPLTINQIKAETGIQLSSLGRRLAHLRYQRLVRVAFKDRCPQTGILVCYYAIFRAGNVERNAAS